MEIKDNYNVDLALIYGTFFLVMLVMLTPFIPGIIDNWCRKDEDVVSKITSIYSREDKYRDKSIKYSVCSTEKDGQIDLEVSNGANVGDEIKYVKNYGPFRIVPTIYKRK